jgi:hypothetical protein
MSYTNAQIKIINEQAKARPGYRYVTADGKVFLGTSAKRLKAIDGINHAAVKKDIKIEDRLSALEVTKDTVVSVDKKISDTKCFALAMSIVL